MSPGHEEGPSSPTGPLQGSAAAKPTVRAVDTTDISPVTAASNASWTTISVTALPHSATQFAVGTGGRYYASRAILLQSSHAGATRVVVGFECDVEVVPADALPDWTGRVLPRIERELHEIALVARQEAM